MAAASQGLAHADLTEYLASLCRQLPDEASVKDRAFALGVGTRELYDTIRDTDKTLELYSALGSSNIKVSAWDKHKSNVELDPSRMPLSKEKSDAVKLSQKSFSIFQRLVQRYRSDGQGVPYLVSSVEYLCLHDEEVAVPRLFVLFRISQTPTQQYGEIMQLHEYLTFYRAGRTVPPGVTGPDKAPFLLAEHTSLGRTLVNYKPAIEYAGSKPILHQLIKRIAIPSMESAFADWIKALGPLAARFAQELMRRARARAKAAEAAEKGSHSGWATVKARIDAGSPKPSADDKASPGAKAGAEEAGASRDGSGGSGGAAAASAAGVGSGSGSEAGAQSPVAGGAADDGSQRAPAAGQLQGKKLFMETVAIASTLAHRSAKHSRETSAMGQDMRRLERRAAALREEAEMAQRDIRRTVHKFVNGQDMTPAGMARAAKQRQEQEAKDAAEREAAAAEGDRVAERRAEMEAVLGGVVFAADDPGRFGLLDEYAMEGAASEESRGMCQWTVPHVDEEELTGRFWSESWARDCSIWPGAVEGDPQATLFGFLLSTLGGTKPAAKPSKGSASELEEASEAVLDLTPDGPAAGGDAQGEAESSAGDPTEAPASTLDAVAGSVAIPRSEEADAAHERRPAIDGRSAAERQKALLAAIVGRVSAALPFGMTTAARRQAKTGGLTVATEGVDDVADSVPSLGRVRPPSSARSGSSASTPRDLRRASAVATTPPPISVGVAGRATTAADLARLLDAVDVLPPPSSQPATGGASAGRSVMPDSRPPRKSSGASGYASGYGTDMENSRDFVALPHDTMQPPTSASKQAARSRRPVDPADMAVADLPNMRARGDCTPADAPCTVM